MRSQTLRSDALLLLASAIWGFAFVAQRIGMEFIGPFLFNGVRFALGALVLVPFIFRHRNTSPLTPARSSLLRAGLPLGLLLFCGANLQQLGLVYTSAGKAGFITGLYVVIVPILGLCWGQRPPLATWVGGVLATAGLFLLSVTEKFTLAPGDGLVLVGALFWACHVLLVGRLATRYEAMRLAAQQFAVCAALSLLVAVVREPIVLDALLGATPAIIYGGAFSAGIAYTLQMVAQRHTPPAHAAIILSLEAVFAVLGGWLLLQETLSGRALLGCSLMLTGMLFSHRFPQQST